jgi:hypothetical protein
MGEMNSHSREEIAVSSYGGSNWWCFKLAGGGAGAQLKSATFLNWVLIVKAVFAVGEMRRYAIAALTCGL